MRPTVTVLNGRKVDAGVAQFSSRLSTRLLSEASRHVSERTIGTLQYLLEKVANYASLRLAAKQLIPISDTTRESAAQINRVGTILRGGAPQPDPGLSFPNQFDVSCVSEGTRGQACRKIS